MTGASGLSPRTPGVPDPVTTHGGRSATNALLIAGLGVTVQSTVPLLSARSYGIASTHVTEQFR